MVQRQRWKRRDWGVTTVPSRFLLQVYAQGLTCTVQDFSIKLHLANIYINILANMLVYCNLCSHLIFYVNCYTIKSPTLLLYINRSACVWQFYCMGELFHFKQKLERSHSSNLKHIVHENKFEGRIAFSRHISNILATCNPILLLRWRGRRY